MTRIDVVGRDNVVAGRDVIQLIVQMTEADLSPDERAARKLRPYGLTMLLSMLAVCGWGMFMMGANYLASVSQTQPPFGEDAIALYGVAGIGWALTAALMRRWAISPERDTVDQVCARPRASAGNQNAWSEA